MGEDDGGGVMVLLLVVVVVSGGGAGAGVYFTGDSLARKSRRLGSRSRRGSLSEDWAASDFPQNQPMVVGWGWGAIRFVESAEGGRRVRVPRNSEVLKTLRHLRL